MRTYRSNRAIVIASAGIRVRDIKEWIKGRNLLRKPLIWKGATWLDVGELMMRKHGENDSMLVRKVDK